MKTATLVTVQGDKSSINLLDPISRMIWRLEINCTIKDMDSRFMFWIEESAKKLHVNGTITVEISKS